MRSAQVTAISSALLYLVDAQERNTRDAANLCAMLSITGRDDGWVQMQLGVLNFAYPHHEHPVELLRRHGVAMLAGLAVDAFEPNRYATLTYDPCSIDEVARFVDALLTAVHALPGRDYGIAVEPEYLLAGPNAASQRSWYLAMPSRWPRGEVAAHQIDGARGELRQPVLATDLWELASAEDRNARSGGRFWIPTAEDRGALKPGDLAQLLFAIQGEDEHGGAEVTEERMWVLVTDARPAGCFLGRLVNQPDCVDPRRHYLTPGAEVPFRIRHIIEIRRWEQSDIDDFLANTLHRKWE
jgi:hypothetical protein